MAFRLIVAFAAALGFSCAAAAAPLEAYGRLPSIEQAEISPSGKYVAYILTSGEGRTVGIESLPDRKPVLIGPAGNTKVRSIAWAGDRRLIITISVSGRAIDVQGPRAEHFMASVMDIETKRLSPLSLGVEGAMTMNTVYGAVDIRTVAGKPVAFVRGMHFPNLYGQIGLFTVDLETLRTKLIEPGSRGDAEDWLIDRNGIPVAEQLYDDRTGVWTLRVREPKGRWRDAYRVEAPIETPDLLGFGRDGKSVLVSLNDEELGAGWRELALDTSTWGEPVPESKEAGAIRAPADGRLIGMVKLVGDRWNYTFFDSQDAAVWRGVQKAYPGETITLQSWSDDRKKIVIRADSPELGAAFALVDLQTHEASWLGGEHPDIKAADISPVKPVRYKAADGLEITGYLTLPRGRPDRGLPLVVLPHGGPASRDVPGFDWWAQALASRGYAVLQPNFRGSSGFGWDFMAAGFGEWGRKMQTDLSDGVRDLVRQGVVDPKRVCIVGASYGGYAALAGVTIDKGVYRCAVSVAGVSNLRDLVTEPGYHSQRWWRRFVGVDDVKNPMLRQYSPTARAGEAEGPVLLIHGRDDTVVPISHSRKMAAALEKAGKPVEFVELKGEDHWLSRGETRQQMLQSTVAFLEKHNPPN